MTATDMPGPTFPRERETAMDEEELHEWRVEPEWHLHSAGAKGVTFRCDYYEDIDGAMEKFKQAMLPVMDAWPVTGTAMSITIT
jgi:hypothetical protein